MYNLYHGVGIMIKKAWVLLVVPKRSRATKDMCKNICLTLYLRGKNLIYHGTVGILASGAYLLIHYVTLVEEYQGRYTKDAIL